MTTARRGIPILSGNIGGIDVAGGTLHVLGPAPAQQPEVVAIDDLKAGDVVSFDEDPERLTVDDVYDLEAGFVDVLFEGYGMPSPFLPDALALRWAQGPTTTEDP